MSQLLLSAAVVIGTLRANMHFMTLNKVSALWNKNCRRKFQKLSKSGPQRDKTCLQVLNKARLKPVCSATETS